jgi:ABC-type sulfate/molybdate transport systems ATPase subunit
MNIKVDNVTKIIKKVKVLDHVSLEFESGEITGLKGINGSGKTMIMRIISGLIRPTEGKVFINGRELKKEMDFPESIGVLIDSPAFLDGYSAYDNLRYILTNAEKEIDKHIESLRAFSDIMVKQQERIVHLEKENMELKEQIQNLNAQLNQQHEQSQYHKHENEQDFGMYL